MLNELIRYTKCQIRAKSKGQGIVEYAGALVVAAALIAAVLAIGPSGIATLMQQIMDFLSETLSSGISSAGSGGGADG
jgi:cytochrome b